MALSRSDSLGGIDSITSGLIAINPILPSHSTFKPRVSLWRYPYGAFAVLSSGSENTKITSQKFTVQEVRGIKLQYS